jgi:mRNA interferase RelE/StbE
MPKAERQLKKLAKRDRVTYLNVIEAVESLRRWPDVENVRKLSSHTYGYRLRIGSYRVLFDVDREVKVVAVQEVKKRDERAY